MIKNNQCTIHKAKEEFLCIKKTCQELQKSLSCYICLSQNHTKTNHIPSEDFKSINSLFELINQDKNQKLKLLDETKFWCVQQKKQTMQEIEKSLFYNPNYHQGIINQIENWFNQLFIYVEEQERILDQISEQNVENLQQIKEFSNQNLQCLEKIIDERRKETSTEVQQLKTKIENNIYEKLELYKTKLEDLENKMNKANSFFWFYKLLSLWVTFLLILVFYCIYQIHNNNTTQLNQNEKMILKHEDLSNTFQIWRKTLNNKIDQLEQKLNLIEEQQNQLLKILNITTNNKIKKIEDRIQDFSQQFQTTKKHLQYLNNISQSEIFYNYTLKHYVGKIHVQMDVFKLKDFKVIYKRKLIQPFYWIDELQILKQVNKDSILCLGGQINTDPDNLLVVACDYASEIFEDTEDNYRARKSKQGDIYWYKVDQYSIGFSPKADIQLQLCDDYEPNDQRRFSIWYNHGKDGGRRIGNRSNLNNSKIHEMIIYAL